ncbi:MAG: hypothetical protein LBQ92_01985 [Propionibacteriaceae bacterium]|nr:hypothetical protein [Propionibacteriaceae bacterium]
MRNHPGFIAAALATTLAAGATFALLSDSATSGAEAIKAGNLLLTRCTDSWMELSADADGVSAASPQSPADFLYQPGDALDFDYCIRGTAQGDNLAVVLDIEWDEVGDADDTFTLYTDQGDGTVSAADVPIAGGPVGTDVRVTEFEDQRLAATWGDEQRNIHWLLRIHRESAFDPAELDYEDAESPDVPGFTVRMGQTRVPVSGYTGTEVAR